MRPVLTGLVALVLVAGCGGGDEPTIPLSEYAKRVDAICRSSRTTVQAELKKLETRLRRDGQLDDDDVASLNRRALELVGPAQDRIAAVPLPEGREDKAKEYVRANREANEALAESVEAYGNGDQEALTAAVSRNRKRGTDALNAAVDLGLDDCGPWTP